jgi:hypothetical protein
MCMQGKQQQHISLPRAHRTLPRTRTCHAFSVTPHSVIAPVGEYTELFPSIDIPVPAHTGLL